MNTEAAQLLAKLEAHERGAHTEDHSKGMSIAEWAEAMGVSEATAGRKIKKMVEANIMEVDTDWRHTGKRWIKVDVYREAE